MFDNFPLTFFHNLNESNTQRAKKANVAKSPNLSNFN